MSKPRYDWWSYAKAMIRKYPSRTGSEPGVAGDEWRAVQAAIDVTERMPDGRERMEIIKMVFWQRTYTLDGAAMQIPCSLRTAQRYHAEFIKEVAKNFKCNQLI